MNGAYAPYPKQDRAATGCLLRKTEAEHDAVTHSGFSSHLGPA